MARDEQRSVVGPEDSKVITPKVFISHASEDKKFAQDLATKLRSKGVNA